MQAVWVSLTLCAWGIGSLWRVCSGGGEGNALGAGDKAMVPSIHRDPFFP
jgi:hypothetical protein